MCTIVHFENADAATGATTCGHYCLVCRGAYECATQMDAGMEWGREAKTKGLTLAQFLQGFPEGPYYDKCPFPRALLAEEVSRHPVLQIDCSHEESHYQDPDFVPQEFWADLAHRYHYCLKCQAYTVECPRARNRLCSVKRVDEPLNDRRLVEIAWVASQVQIPLPPGPNALQRHAATISNLPSDQ